MTSQSGLVFQTRAKTRTVPLDGRTERQLTMATRSPTGQIYSQRIVRDGIVDPSILEILILTGKLIRASKNKDRDPRTARDLTDGP